MRNTNSTIALWIVAVSAGVVTFQNCLAGDTNAAAVETVDLQFENAPVIAGVDWLTRLTNKPLITPMHLVGTITYRTKRKLTREEAIGGIAGALETNGLYFVNVGDLYNRLVTISETNNVVDSPRIEVEAQADGVAVNGQSVPLQDLTGTISNSITADVEVWISVPSTPVGEMAIPRIEMAILKAGAKKVYRVFLPPPK